MKPRGKSAFRLLDPQERPKRRHKTGRSDHACPSESARRLLRMLNTAGDCSAYQEDPKHTGKCLACGAGRALHKPRGAFDDLYD